MERKKIKVKRGNLKKKKKTSASERSERAGGVWGALPPEILVCGGLSRISVRSFTVESARHVVTVAEPLEFAHGDPVFLHKLHQCLFGRIAPQVHVDTPEVFIHLAARTP